MATLCKAALEEASKASVVPDGDPSVEAEPSRARRRKRKNKRRVNFSSVVGDADTDSADNVVPYVHPDPPLRKIMKTVSNDEDGGGTHDPVGIDITGIALVDKAGTMSHPPGDEVRVVRACAVADKKGQRHQINRPRTVSTRFGQSSVDAYVNLLSSALAQKMEDFFSRSTTSSSVGLNAKQGPVKCPGDVPKVAAAKEEVVGVISYTEELSKNVVRTGVPPPLPKFTRVAMWRGEDVCLNQLGAGDMNELLVGINWCEPKGYNGSIDLDLSVMVSCLDSRWCHYCVYFI